jgi:hypothetical protein
VLSTNLVNNPFAFRQTRSRQVLPFTEPRLQRSGALVLSTNLVNNPFVFRQTRSRQGTASIHRAAGA